MKTIAIVLFTTAGLAAADKAPMPDPPAAAAPPVMAVRRPPLPPPKPVVAAPSPEVAKLGKATAGAYKCKGVSLRGDGSSTPLEASLTIKLELDNAWVHASLAETKAGGLKFDEYRTYDPTAKQWTRIQLASTSGHVVSTSLGEQGGKWTWEGTASSPNGSLQVRDYEQRDAKQLKVWGEALLGGTWQKLYEATCKE